MTAACEPGERRPRRYLILPADIEVGWTPFLWLIYLAGPFVYLILGPDEPVDWLLAVASVVVFLPLYFWGYWTTGRRLLGIIAAVTLLAAVYTPLNAGGFVYFVYAAAFVGYAVAPGTALKTLGLILLTLGVDTWLFEVHPSAWIPATIFSALVGLTGVHYAEVQRKNNSLRRAREEVERIAKTAERERIARDLHDLLGHTLTLISVKSDLAIRLAERDPDRARHEMEEVHRTARQALAEVRRAVRGYRADGTGGLRRELESARAALTSAGLAVEVEGDEPETLARAFSEHGAPEHEEALALALREAATNVLRHARASRCRVQIERRGDVARLRVSDDGRGGVFSSSHAAAAGDGHGLAGMRERVERLGGRLTLRGGPSGRGATLTVELPLAPEAVERPAGTTREAAP